MKLPINKGIVEKDPLICWKHSI